MRCPDCSLESRQGRRFCAGCGRELSRACSACGAESDAEDRFCGACGVPLVPARTHRVADTPDISAGDLRQVTILFCDLVGSTAHAHQRGPETWFEVVHTYRDSCSREIENWGGTIGQFLGDGVLGYFGYPTALENHAECAVHAGLSLLTALEELNAENATHGLHLEARIGIHTGRVVALDRSGHGEPPIVGETVHLASRYEGMAGSNDLVISEETHQVVRGAFEVKSLGSHRVKGVAEPLAAYRVLSATGTPDGQSGEAEIPPMVGRREELALLLDRWKRVTRGSGQVVVLAGEAGIGKSRLIAELERALAAKAAASGRATCSLYHRNTSLTPILELAKQAADWEEEDPSELRAEKLDAALEQAGLSPERAIPVMREMFRLPASNRYPPPELAPEERRKLILDVFFRWLEATAGEGPVLLTIEDLQWADPSTLELVNLVIRGAHRIQVLLVLTYRPGFDPTWGMPSHLSTIVLPRLNPTQAAKVARRAAGGHTIPAGELRSLIDRANGVPLYIEELARHFVTGARRPERDEGDRSPTAQIPATLEGLLAVRLERTGPAREISQLAAVIGDEVPFSLLQQLSGRSEAELDSLLETLVDSEILAQRGKPPRSTYVFEHTLVRDAALNSVLRRRRRALHRQVARILEEGFPETAHNRPEQLAFHLSKSDDPASAIPYWRRAAARAVQNFAIEEAIAHTRAALRLIPFVADASERAHLEAHLQLSLGSSLAGSRGFGNASVEEPLLRAHELCSQIGDGAPFVPVLAFLCGHYMQRGNHQRTRLLGEELLLRTESGGENAPRVVAHFLLGMALLLSGEYEASLANTEKGRALYDPEDFVTIGTAATEPGVVSFCVGGLARWCLGEPGRALREAEAGVELARTRKQPHHHTMGWALTFKTQLLLLLRAAPEALACATELKELAAEHEFHRLAAWGCSLAACARIEAGDWEDGIAELEPALSDYGDEEAGFWRAYCFGILARGHAALGSYDEGFRLLRRAKRHAKATGERFCQSDLHRIEGELILAASPDDLDRAAACFERAICHARHDRAVSFELRAATSLARVRLRQGRGAEALYEHFSEGFETPDLIEAAAVLESLATSGA
jgi:class 3 adenylate cyclase/predicted ATPase